METRVYLPVCSGTCTTISNLLLRTRIKQAVFPFSAWNILHQKGCLGLEPDLKGAHRINGISAAQHIEHIAEALGQEISGSGLKSSHMDLTHMQLPEQHADLDAR